ncbi:MAG: DUF3866 family protein [Actinomycetota bacterium]
MTVLVGDQERRAAAFTDITGPLCCGDRVVVNTTAVDLALGTGGEDFVLWNLEATTAGELCGGHILKLRYTPWQIDIMAAEAPESEHHEVMAAADSLEGMPVVAAAVHSQLPGVLAVLRRRRPDLRLAYLMTDAAALPIAHSDLVAALLERGLIDATLTCGHAVGGDLECVNVFSGLAAARRVAGADVTVVGMGPGIVGTATLLGHSAMEQGQTLSAAGALGGRPVAVLRISFAEPRERHRVLSHHSLSALRYAALARSIVAVPRLEEAHLSQVMARLEAGGITERHEIRVVDADEALEALESFDLRPTTMGRDPSRDPDYFKAAAAAGIIAAELARGQGENPDQGGGDES